MQKTMSHVFLNLAFSGLNLTIFIVISGNYVSM